MVCASGTAFQERSEYLWVSSHETENNKQRKHWRTGESLKENKMEKGKDNVLQMNADMLNN